MKFLKYFVFKLKETSQINENKEDLNSKKRLKHQKTIINISFVLIGLL